MYCCITNVTNHNPTWIYIIIKYSRHLLLSSGCWTANTMATISNARAARRWTLKAGTVFKGRKVPYDSKIGCKYSASAIFPDSLKNVAPCEHWLFVDMSHICQNKMRLCSWILIKNSPYPRVCIKTSRQTNHCF